MAAGADGALDAPPMAGNDIDSSVAIVQDGRALVTLPIDSPVFEGMCIIFGGRRWKILNVCSDPAVLTVAPDPSGRPPIFDSGRAMVHEKIRTEMRNILAEDSDIGFLDSGAQGLLF
jgi:ATP-dependent Lhr-like helicase